MKKPYRYPSGRVSYPWDNWFTKSKFRLHRGVEYFCLTHCMNILVRGAATARGLQVSIHVEEGDVLAVTVL